MASPNALRNEDLTCGELPRRSNEARRFQGEGLALDQKIDHHVQKAPRVFKPEQGR